MNRTIALAVAASLARAAAPAPPAPAPAPALERGPSNFVRYRSPHPIPAAAGGGFCAIMRMHFHGYDVAELATHFAARHDMRMFIGDPVAFGFDGVKHAYWFHHPLPGGVGFCFIDGPHWHAFLGGAAYKKGADEMYFYTGPLPENYQDLRKQAAERTKFYKDRDYARPAAPKEIPPEWTALWKDVLAGKPVPKEAIAPAGSDGLLAPSLLSPTALGKRLKLLAPAAPKPAGK